MSMLEIAETIGFDAAVVLMDNFGGIGSFYIPRGAYRRLKKSLIIEADGNISNRQLCRILGVTERYVLKVKAELKENEQQGVLF